MLNTYWLNKMDPFSICWLLLMIISRWANVRLKLVKTHLSLSKDSSVEARKGCYFPASLPWAGRGVLALLFCLRELPALLFSARVESSFRPSPLWTGSVALIAQVIDQTRVYCDDLAAEDGCRWLTVCRGRGLVSVQFISIPLFSVTWWILLFSSPWSTDLY